MPTSEIERLRYTASEIDALAYAACETVVAAPGVVVPYDVENYERISRQSVPTGEYPYYSPEYTEVSQKPPQLSRSQCLDCQPYILRIGGYRRNCDDSPEEVAKILVNAGIRFADSLGHGLFEHLVLCRRYGIIPTFEAPAIGFPYPFLDEELPLFRNLYQQQIHEFKTWIERAECIYGHPILKRSQQPWILWTPHSPLALFALSAKRRPLETAELLKSNSGTFRLIPSPSTPEDRATQLKAWSFIRRRHMQVRQIMAETLRETIAQDAILIDNTHTLPIVDYELLGSIYDCPGVAVRSGYLEDEQQREPNISYAVRLFHDLTGRIPVASIRVNTTAAGTRFIPGRNAIRQWYDAALRHGVAGFYLWPIDYPSREGQYQGIMSKNPDPSTRGRERWNSQLELLREISGVKRFQPPPASIGILVPYDFMDLQDWRKIRDTFVAFEREQVLVNLLSGRAVERDGDFLQRIESLFVPACTFASQRLIDRLVEYAHSGGTLIVTDPEAMRYDTDGNQRRSIGGLAVRCTDNRPSLCHKIGNGKVLFARECQPKALAGNVNTNTWIYNLHASNLKDITGRADQLPEYPLDPDSCLRHYLYEHSSSFFLPHVDRAGEAFSDRAEADTEES